MCGWIHVCIYVQGQCTGAMTCMETKQQCGRLTSHFPPCGSQGVAVFRLGTKCLYSLCHPTSPESAFFLLRSQKRSVSLSRAPSDLQLCVYTRIVENFSDLGSYSLTSHTNHFPFSTHALFYVIVISFINEHS